MAVISLMAVMSAFYSIRYMEHYPEYRLWSYYLCFPLFILGMIGIVTVDDLSIGFSLAWQVMTIASYFLIRFEYREGKRPERQQVPRPDGARLGAYPRRGVLRRRLRFGDPLPVMAGKMAGTEACRSSDSTGSSSPASGSRPVSSPSASCGCPTPTRSRPRPSAPSSPAS